MSPCENTRQWSWHCATDQCSWTEAISSWTRWCPFLLVCWLSSWLQSWSCQPSSSTHTCCLCQREAFSWLGNAWQGLRSWPRQLVSYQSVGFVCFQPTRWHWDDRALSAQTFLQFVLKIFLLALSSQLIVSATKTVPDWTYAMRVKLYFLASTPYRPSCLRTPVGSRRRTWIRSFVYRKTLTLRIWFRETYQSLMRPHRSLPYFRWACRACIHARAL